MNQGNPFCPSFDSVPCTRCNATGERPSATGLVRQCFPCSGTGQILTRRGRVARDYMRDLLLTPVHSVSAGQHLWFCTGMRKEFVQVISIRQHKQCFALVGRRADGQTLTVHRDGSELIEYARGADELLQIRQQVEAYQASLTLGGYPRKRTVRLAA